MGDTGKIEQLWLSDAMRVTSEELLEPWCVCRRCFDGCAAFLDECADHLVGMGKSAGSRTRKVLFSVNDTEGVVVQIRDVDASFSTEEVSLECGPDITISIRLLPKDNKLDVSMGRGQWLLWSGCLRSVTIFFLGIGFASLWHIFPRRFCFRL